MPGRLRIAVVGAGISGLSAAWLLSQCHDVTLIEAEPRLGGHSNTVDVPTALGPVPVDTGFIVYNEGAYPNLVALFRHLGVETTCAGMSFAVSLGDGAYEYSGSGIAGLFGQRRNLVRPSHYRMAADILRFFRQSRTLLDDGPGNHVSLGAWLATHGYSEVFIDRHILPMAAAIWSTPSAQVLDYPVTSFVRFFANHGLLQASGQPAWRTVVGGSRSYVERLRHDFAGRIEPGAPVAAIRRRTDGVDIVRDGRVDGFDACLIATHADRALRLLADPDPLEREILSPFRYAPNTAVLHRDASHMPRRRRLWSSWNYLGDLGRRDDSLAVTYWMNSLQPLPAHTGDVFVTLNPRRPIAADRTIAAFAYDHPIIDAAAADAQERLWTLQGRRRTWFAGSYFGAGFHEDGLQAGLAAAEDVGGLRRPWTVANESGRIHVLRRSSDQPAARLEAAE